MGSQHSDTKQSNFGAGPGVDTNMKAHIFYQRCLVILQCTAKALCSTPGGFRFKAGSQPWLEGLFEGSQGNIRIQAGR